MGGGGGEEWVRGEVRIRGPGQILVGWDGTNEVLCGTVRLCSMPE